MANPNEIQDIIDVQVNLLDGVASAAGFSNPLFIAQFSATASFPDRFKVYTGSAQTIDTALANDGFAVTDAARRMAAAATAQDGPPSTIVIGRWDPGDADLTTGLDAIWDEITADESVDAYAITVDPLVTSDAEWLQGFNWVTNKFAIFFAQSKSTSITSNTPGNLAEQGLAIGSDRFVLTWHDAEVASKLGPAVLTSNAGPYNIPDGSQLQIRIDGGPTQTFTFDSASATLTGLNTEPFAFTDGDTLQLAIDGGATQTITFDTTAATVTSGAAETYNIVNNDDLSVRVDGGAPQPVVFNGTAGSLTTAAEPYAFLAGDDIDFRIDGGGVQNIAFDPADTTAAAVFTKLSALTGVTVVNNGTTVTVTSNRLGTSSNVRVDAGDANALTELGLVVGDNLGTGFAAFLDAATAAEVATEINGDTVGLTADGSSGSVVITSDTIGTDSRIQITGGSANGEFDFSTNEQVGTGDFADASAATAAEVALKLNNASFGFVTTIAAGAVVLTTNSAGSASQINIIGGINAATTLGLALGSVFGSGDFANAAQAQASEVAAEISLSIASGTASTVSNAVVISTTSTGTAASIEVIGGSAAALLGFSGSAVGVGTDEDYADTRWIGRSITFNLDAENGAALWDNQSPRGGFPDTIDAQTRSVLHNTLRVNTFERRQGRNEFHFGYLLNSAQRYIDERTSADWGDARITEAIKNDLNIVADKKTKIPISDEGIQRIANTIRRVLALGDRNGHWFFDDSPIDPDIVNDTGFNVPTVADLTEQDIADRKLTGFVIVQRLKGGFQKAAVRFDLTRVLAQT